MIKTYSRIEYNDTDKCRITLIENLHRRELNDTEKGYGILAVYESAGYPDPDAAKGTKSIATWFFDHNKGRLDWQIYTRNIDRPKPRSFKASELVYDKKFIGICKAVGYHPNTQFRFLKLVLDLEKGILEEAEKQGAYIRQLHKMIS